MLRKFNYQSVQYAERIQCPDREKGWGYIYCKTCGHKIDNTKGDKRYPCQITPTENGGGFDKENCMIICGNCYPKIMAKRQYSLTNPPKDDPNSLYSDE